MINKFQQFLAAVVDPGDIPCSSGNCEPTGSGIASTIIIWSYVIIGIIAVTIIIYAGIQFITSEGEPEKSKRAQATITYTVIGLIIATAAAAIISFVTGAFA